MLNIINKIFTNRILNRIDAINKFPVIHFAHNHNRAGVETSGSQTIIETGSPKFKYKTIELIKKWSAKLEEAGVVEAKLSVENIIAHVFKTRKLTDVYKTSNSLLSRSQVRQIIKMCKLRSQRMPLQYIIGDWDFRELTLKMSPPVFIPRPETELLVDLIIAELDTTCPTDIEETVLELCCGSGAISLSLLKERPNLKVIAIDKSIEACKLTQENADMLGLSDRIEIRQMDLNDITEDSFNRRFKIIVGNPPYIPSYDMMSLQKEVMRYEDKDALDGGDWDGLVLIKLILQKSSHLLCNDNNVGKIFLEVNPTHPRLLKKTVLGENNHLGLSIHEVHKDIFQRDRFVIIKKI